MSIPTYKQIATLKAANPDTILLFGDGDTIHVFGEDADKVAPILDVGLIPDQHGNSVLGFPRESLESKLTKLVQAGHRAAVCEQVVGS